MIVISLMNEQYTASQLDYSRKADFESIDGKEHVEISDEITKVEYVICADPIG